MGGDGSPRPASSWSWPPGRSQAFFLLAQPTSQAWRTEERMGLFCGCRVNNWWGSFSHEHSFPSHTSRVACLPDNRPHGSLHTRHVAEWPGVTSNIYAAGPPDLQVLRQQIQSSTDWNFIEKKWCVWMEHREIYFPVIIPKLHSKGDIYIVFTL